jgi:hypothetical protein
MDPPLLGTASKRQHGGGLGGHHAPQGGDAPLAVMGSLAQPPSSQAGMRGVAPGTPIFGFHEEEFRGGLLRHQGHERAEGRSPVRRARTRAQPWAHEGDRPEESPEGAGVLLLRSPGYRSSWPMKVCWGSRRSRSVPKRRPPCRTPTGSHHGGAWVQQNAHAPRVASGLGSLVFCPVRGCGREAHGGWCVCPRGATAKAPLCAPPPLPAAARLPSSPPALPGGHWAPSNNQPENCCQAEEEARKRLLV